MSRHRALIVGHADADGHIIVEQSRRNLAETGAFDIKIVVDPARTKDHKAWTHLEAIEEIVGAEYVFFLDLMFAPASYAEEARALMHFARSYPEKRFFLIDHHPLPLQRLAAADNLRVMYRPDVAECAIGPRSGMMVVAALCEPQFSEAASEVKNSLHETLARGMKRAAALGGPLPGEKLLALLKADRWIDLLALGREDPKFHQLPRGRRARDQPQSETLAKLEENAVELLPNPQGRRAHVTNIQAKGTTMAYDVDVGKQELSYDTGRYNLQRNVPPSPKDLGVITTMLELAALSLTTAPGTTFTLEQLIREARDIAGGHTELREEDVKIVLKKARFVEKVGKEFRLR